MTQLIISQNCGNLYSLPREGQFKEPVYPQLPTSQPTQPIPLSLPTPVPEQLFSAHFSPLHPVTNNELPLPYPKLPTFQELMQPIPLSLPISSAFPPHMTSPPPPSGPFDDIDLEILAEHPQFELNEKEIRKLISEQASVLKAQFEYSGTVTLEEMNRASDVILNRSSKDGISALPGMSPKYLLLHKTFGLSDKTSEPFEEVRKNIVKEQPSQLEGKALSLTTRLANLFRSQPSSSIPQSPSEQEIADLKAKKLETLRWAEQEWSNLFKPSAPPIDIDDMEFIITEDEAPFLTDVTPQLLPPAPALQGRVVPVAPQRAIEPIVSERREGIPLVSYVDLAYGYLFNTGRTDEEVWNSLPEAVQRDVLRHSYCCSSTCQGRVEDYAKRRFNQSTFILRDEFNKLSKPIGTTDWSREGERLIELYYSKEGIDNPLKVIHQFQAFTPLPLFLDCIGEAAGAVGVDRQYAVDNWHQTNMIALSVQSLERCLHTGLRY